MKDKEWIAELTKERDSLFWELMKTRDMLNIIVRSINQRTGTE